MRLVLLSPPTDHAREIPLLRELLDAGVSTFHLRKPGAPETRLRAYLSELSPEHRARVVLHSCHGLVTERGLGVKGPWQRKRRVREDQNAIWLELRGPHFQSLTAAQPSPRCPR